MDNSLKTILLGSILHNNYNKSDSNTWALSGELSFHHCQVPSLIFPVQVHHKNGGIESSPCIESS